MGEKRRSHSGGKLSQRIQVEPYNKVSEGSRRHRKAEKCAKRSVPFSGFYQSIIHIDRLICLGANLLLFFSMAICPDSLLPSE